jgi:hypothetical protein
MMRYLVTITASVLVLAAIGLWLRNDKATPTPLPVEAVAASTSAIVLPPNTALLHTIPTELANAAMSTAAPLLATNQTALLPDPGVCPVITDILLDICQQGPGESYCQQ